MQLFPDLQAMAEKGIETAIQEATNWYANMLRRIFHIMPDADLRAKTVSVVAAAAEKGDERALQVLLDALQHDTDAHVRASAVSGVAAMAAKGIEAALQAVMHVLREDDVDKLPVYEDDGDEKARYTPPSSANLLQQGDGDKYIEAKSKRTVSQGTLNSKNHTRPGSIKDTHKKI